MSAQTVTSHTVLHQLWSGQDSNVSVSGEVGDYLWI